jgi:hypothetical protein
MAKGPPRRARSLLLLLLSLPRPDCQQPAVSEGITSSRHHTPATPARDHTHSTSAAART